MKRLKKTLLSLLLIALIFGVVFGCMKVQHIPGLLEQAGLPLSCVRGLAAADSFTDWLNYTDGYDYAVLKVDPATFTPPEDWEQGAAAIEAINPAPEGLGCYDFHWDFLHHVPLPESYTAWRYIPRDPSLPFEEQQWFAAMYDASTGTLVLFRAHSFYGSRGFD